MYATYFSWHTITPFKKESTATLLHMRQTARSKKSDTFQLKARRNWTINNVLNYSIFLFRRVFAFKIIYTPTFF